MNRILRDFQVAFFFSINDEPAGEELSEHAVAVIDAIGHSVEDGVTKLSFADDLLDPTEDNLVDSFAGLEEPAQALEDESDVVGHTLVLSAARELTSDELGQLRELVKAAITHASITTGVQASYTDALVYRQWVEAEWTVLPD